MTRINVVPPQELVNLHLLAEYRELPRVFRLARPCPDAPKEYTLGKGHVKFFYDKLFFLLSRQQKIVAELTARGYRLNFDCKDLGQACYEKQSLWNDYTPTLDALSINRQRITDRLATMKV